ncbi:MAG: carbon-nitrogen hydrolase family protein [Pseudomonadota bacterium]
MRAALVQLNASDDWRANLAETERLVRQGAEEADLVLTPEVTNVVSSSRAHQESVLFSEAEDPTLARLREIASETATWIAIGSLALKDATEDDTRFVNRGFLLTPSGEIAARYDKIHMFDVDLERGERYRESDAFRPGLRAPVVTTPLGRIGLSICYDLRFGALYRALAQAGAEILLVPAAFTVPTGRAHWQSLLRARAIETGSFVLAAAQWGSHAASDGRPRQTWGHSLAIGPWGEILGEGGVGIGVTVVECNLEAVAKARQAVPSLRHDRALEIESLDATKGATDG